MADIAHSSFSGLTGSVPMFAPRVEHVTDGPPPIIEVEKHPVIYYVGGRSGVWRTPDLVDLKPTFV